MFFFFKAVSRLGRRRAFRGKKSPLPGRSDLPGSVPALLHVASSNAILVHSGVAASSGTPEERANVNRSLDVLVPTTCVAFF